METECLRWPDYCTTIASSIEQFWNDGSFADVRLAVAGATFAAHRAVLAARSAGLRRLLLAADTADVTPLLYLRGVDADQLRQLLQLLYTGTVRADRRQLHDLRDLCRELEIDDLHLDVSDQSSPDHKEPLLTALPASPPSDVRPPSRSEGGPRLAGSAGHAATPTPVAVVETRSTAAKSLNESDDAAVSAQMEPLDPTLKAVSPPADTGYVSQPLDPTLKAVSPPADTGYVSQVYPQAADSAGYRHLAAMLDSLSRRQLLQLHEQARAILSPDFTSWLPDEIMIEVLSWLQPRDLLRACGVCPRWRALADDPSVWNRCCRLTGADATCRIMTSRQIYMQWLSWMEQPVRMPKRLRGHAAVIRCMAVDGDRIVTGSYDRTVAVWSASVGRMGRHLATQSEVTCVQTCGDLVVSACRDGSLQVWDAVQGRLLHTLAGHDVTVWSLALHGTRAVSGSHDKTVRLWDVLAGRLQAVMRGHQASVRAVCLDGVLVVSGDDDGSVRVWSAETGREENVWRAASPSITTLQHDCGVVVSGHGHGAITVWDMESRRLRHELRTAHHGWVTDICVRDGRLLSGCKDGSVVLWDLHTGGPLHRFDGGGGHRQRVTAVRLLAGLAVTSSRDGHVKLWDCQSGSYIRSLVTPEVSCGPVKHLWVSEHRLVCSVQNNASDRPEVLVFDMRLLLDADGRRAEP